MRINRGYRFKLRPTEEQAKLLFQHVGVCRLVYNLALEQRRDHHRQYRAATGTHISYGSQAAELTALRAEFDWIRAVTQTENPRPSGRGRR
jgi:putative transposase